MKTCKKILASVLALAMVLSMCAFVSADEAAGTETATSKLLTLHNFDGSSVGIHKSNIAANDGLYKPALNFRSISNASNGIQSGTVAEKADGDNYHIATSNWFGYNYNKTDVDFAGYGAGDYPVLSISYDIMIPNDDEYKEFARRGYFNVGTTKTQTSTTAATVWPTIENGNLFVTADSSTAKYTKTLDYTYGSWVNFNTLVWVNDSNKLDIAVYADDTLVYYGSGTKTVVGLAAAQLNFEYFNKLDGTSRLVDKTTANWSDGIHKDATTGEVDSVVSKTCYDNITIQLLQESAKVTEADFPYVEIVNFPADEVKSVLPSTGLITTSLLKGGATEGTPVFTAVARTDGVEGNYLEIKSKDYTYLPQNARSSFSKYVGNSSTFIWSYDLYMSEDSSSTSRKIGVGLGLDLNNLANTNPLRRITHDLEVFTNVKDGVIGITSDAMNLGKDVAGTERSETRPVIEGEWVNIKYIYEVTKAETQYEIKVYGVYNNDVIHVSEHTIEYYDNNQDGVSDDLCYGQTMVYIGEAKQDETAEIVTGLDNMSFVKDNSFDIEKSGINTDAWLNRVVEFSTDESGNIDVYAKKGGEEGFTSGILVIAMYDEKGALIKGSIITSTDREDGTFSYEIPADMVAGASMVKGFVFDSLTSATPLMPHGVILLD